jgi:transposase InsO family protein
MLCLPTHTEEAEMHEAFWNGLFDTRWEDAPLGPEAIRLVLRMRDRGYAERTRRDCGHAVVHLGRVLHAELGGADQVLNEEVVGDFIDRHLPVCRCYRRTPGRRQEHVRSGLVFLVAMLREEGAIPSVVSAEPPYHALLDGYCRFLRRDRGLAETTVTNYQRYLRDFLASRGRNLGHELGRNTIKRILLEHSLDPAPKRGKTMPWKTFLKAHLGVIAATDFFTVEALTLGGLVRYVVWFVIDLESRRVHIAGLIRHAHDAWTQQVARNLTDCVDGFLRGKRYLIHDRDPLFTDAFRAVLRAAGIECLKLPARSPNLDAVAERFVLSIKSECLDKLVPLGERHLRVAISEFVEHYHLERNHQGVDNRLLTAVAAPANENVDSAAPVARRERLGGILSYYYRPAA